MKAEVDSINHQITSIKKLRNTKSLGKLQVKQEFETLESPAIHKRKTFRLSAASPNKKAKSTKRLDISKINLDNKSVASPTIPKKRRIINHDSSPNSGTIPRLKLKFNIKKLTQIDEED